MTMVYLITYEDGRKDIFPASGIYSFSDIVRIANLSGLYYKLVVTYKELLK